MTSGSQAGAPLLNPYLELWRAVTAGVADPESLATIRRQCVWAYAWGIPAEEAVLRLAEWGSFVELGAGTGYWAWMLGQAGARVRAFDRNPSAPPSWHAVEEGGPAVLGDPERTPQDSALLLCWPPYEEPMAVDALRAFRGRRVAYVGEWRGRTADAAFHDLLEAEYDPHAELPLPNWPGWRDRLFLFER